MAKASVTARCTVSEIHQISIQAVIPNKTKCDSKPPKKAIIKAEIGPARRIKDVFLLLIECV